MINLFNIFKKTKLPVVNSDLSQPEVDHWQISEFIVNKLVPIIGWHPYPLPELQLMTSAVCWQNPTHIFDWGTHLGISARIFYEIKRHFKLKVKIFSIDLPDEQEHCEHPGKLRGKFVKDIKEVTLIQGDGVTEALKLCKKFNISNALFFLDGDHEYKSVKKELNLIVKNIKNPTMLLHDTFFQDPKGGYNIGPYKASNEFIKMNKKFQKISTNFGRPGMDYIFRK